MSVSEYDEIMVRGIRADARHGVYVREQETDHPFTADVTAFVSARSREAGDELSSTVDYGSVADAVHHVLAGEPVRLIETVAERAAEAVLSLAGVQCVRVTVHKPEAPLDVPFDDVSVTVMRGATSAVRTSDA